MDYFNVLFSTITRVISKLVPKKKNRWVFGAWFGNNISDNSKAIYDYIRENNKEIEPIWVVREPEKFKDMDCRVVKRNSIKGCIAVMRAKVAVFNQGYMDFCTFDILGGAYSVQLWHGVAWKKIGLDSWEDSKSIKDRLYRWAFKKITKYKLFIAPADNYAEIIKKAFNAPVDRIMKVGQPRNDILFDEKNNELERKALLNMLGVKDDNVKIVVYMPTFRDKKQKACSFFDEDHFEEITRLATENNFILVEKSHFKDSTRNNDSMRETDRVFMLPNYDAAKLLGAADMLVTDYSSCFFDFAVRNKPIVYYIYDYEYYKNKDRGLYYEYDDIAGGTVAFNRDEVLDAIANNIENPELEKEKRARLVNEFVTYEGADNSKKIVNRIISESK